MTQYFIDLRDVRGIVRDEEGAEFSSLEEALDEAKASARDLIKQYLDNGFQKQLQRQAGARPSVEGTAVSINR